MQAILHMTLDRHLPDLNKTASTISKRLWLVALIVIFSLLLVVVALIHNNLSSERSDAEPPSTIRIGVLPEENSEKLKMRYQPLLA